MKKLFVSMCLCLIFAMIPMMAMAMSQQEWDQQCRMKTSEAMTLYKVVSSADITPEEWIEGTDVPMKAVGTVPAGAYVKLGSYDDGIDMREIGYFDGTSEVWGFVRSNATIPAVNYVQFDDGESIDVPEALMQDTAALYSYLAGEMPGYTFSMQDGVIHREKDTSAGGYDWKKIQEDAKEATTQLQVNADELPSATVYAPKTGKASLRSSASSKATVIEKVSHGTIVSIVEEGKNFTKVIENGKTGYILTSALKKIDPTQQPVGTGSLSYKGNERIHTEINVRGDGTGKGRKIDEWPTGTEVVVWSQSEDGQWYEIEANGMRVYVQSDFLLISETETETKVDGETQETEKGTSEVASSLMNE